MNLRDLNRFDEGTVVDAQALAEAGLIKGSFDYIKVLGKGDVEKALTIKVDRISAGAKAKIEKAGGKVETGAATDQEPPAQEAKAEAQAPEEDQASAETEKETQKADD